MLSLIQFAFKEFRLDFFRRPLDSKRKIKTIYLVSAQNTIYNLKNPDTYEYQIIAL